MYALERTETKNRMWKSSKGAQSKGGTEKQR